jgi:hypothetical protein
MRIKRASAVNPDRALSAEWTSYWASRQTKHEGMSEACREQERQGDY